MKKSRNIEDLYRDFLYSVYSGAELMMIDGLEENPKKEALHKLLRKAERFDDQRTIRKILKYYAAYL